MRGLKSKLFIVLITNSMNSTEVQNPRRKLYAYKKVKDAESFWREPEGVANCILNAHRHAAIRPARLLWLQGHGLSFTVKL